MSYEFYKQLSDTALNGGILSDEMCADILASKNIELLSLLNEAYVVRQKYFGKEVSVHILNNVQNGFCPEDCHYCAQGKASKADIEKYPVKSDEEILKEAKTAYEKGAHRYCMVFSGRGPTEKRVDHLCELIGKIKKQYPLEICVSAGLLDDEKALRLKKAGLNRLNHNLNTSAKHYEKICTTHTYDDRLNTLKSAKKVGLDVCSGLIIGMNETMEDVIEVAKTLREMKAESIPINLYIPVAGNNETMKPIEPQYALRVAALFRFLNPQADIRMAAGRELHLRSMEVLALYPANSIFIDGYLNVLGESRLKTYQMIKDAGFHIKSDQSIENLIDQEKNNMKQNVQNISIKNLKELRPNLL